MTLRTIAFTLFASVASVSAQLDPLIAGLGNIVVTSSGFNEKACLTSNGSITQNKSACGLFTATPMPEAKSVFDGSTVNAGAGACGWDLKQRSAPLVCGSATTSQLGFYDFDGKMATQELQTEWFADGTTLYWQGLHPDTATLTWVPAKPE